MTPQEKELILSVAGKLKNSPNKPKDAEAEQLITNEIGAQQDAIYKLTQAVLVQEMALKELKQKNDYLQQSSEYYKKESQRGTMSKMFGGNRPAPMPPQPPVRQPSAFGGFMQTAAGVAAGMVAGHLISDMLFNDDSSETAATDTSSDETAAADTATDNTADASADSVDSNANTDTAQNDVAADQNTDAGDSSFLNDSSDFASDYTDSGFGSDLDSGFGADSFANNDSFDNSFLGGDDSGFGGDDFGDDDF